MKQTTFKIIILLCLTISLSFAHKQHVHQYFVREGYNLLKLSLGSDIPEMVDHVGWTEGYSGPTPWSTGLISSGAWGEDEEDPVYGIFKYNPPSITGIGGSLPIGIAQQIIDLFSAHPGGRRFCQYDTFLVS